MFGCPILTYHSQLLFGNDYANNSHVALAVDLEVIARSGRYVIGLRQLLAALHGRRDLPLERLVCLTFDDGPDFDWLDIDHPEHGPQPSFARLLREHAAKHPGPFPITATSFVLADADARARISVATMGEHWMHDHWWRDAAASGLLQIDSHGLDHRHPCLRPGDPAFGHFRAVADADTCRAQVELASTTIAQLSGQRPRVFAYPYGEASDYLRYEYLPRHGPKLGLLGAVGSEPGSMHWDSDPWYLPRYVAQAHWRSPEELALLLRD